MTGSYRFDDRLDRGTYENDDELVAVFEHDLSDADAVWLSARLLRRLTYVARAYDLHTLPMLDDPEPLALNRPRCEGLLDEITFVEERLDDALAVETAQVIKSYLAKRLRRPSWQGTVTFEVD